MNTGRSILSEIKEQMILLDESYLIQLRNISCYKKWWLYESVRKIIENNYSFVCYERQSLLLFCENDYDGFTNE